MSFPKGNEEAKARFRSLVPEDPRVEVRPMFGHLGAFVNRNMFMALFAADIAVRLSDEDGSRLMQEPGASPFEPMPGRAMKGYVVIPAAWRDDPARAGEWVRRSLDWVSAMPPKVAPRKKT